MAPAQSVGRALAGFLLSGFLLALLGAILPAWGYHRDPADFVAVGNYFLSLALGIVAAAVVSRRIIARSGARFILVFACLLACGALLYLALVTPPASEWWRVAGLLVLGLGAGSLNTALFHAISPCLPGRRRRHGDSRRHLVRLGMPGSHPAGGRHLLCLLRTHDSGVHGAGARHLCRLYARSHFAATSGTAQVTTDAAGWRDFRSPGAILFALLLFFQFGNEWSIAGWLPLFLIRRVGLSPQAALMMLALYWLAAGGPGGRRGDSAPWYGTPVVGAASWRPCSAACCCC